MKWYAQFLTRFGLVGVLLTVLLFAYLVSFLMYGILGPAQFDAFFMKVSLPASLAAAVRQPWAIFTYWLSSHPLNFWFFLFDLVVLYSFGHILNAMVGDRRTQGIIIISILSNALITIALCNLLPTVEHTPATRMAGFGAVNATLIAATITLVPRYNFRVLFWDVPLLYIGIFMLLLTIVSHRAIFTMQGTSEIVSALIGFALIKVLRSGWDLTNWFQGVAQRPKQAPPRQPEPVYSTNRPVVRAISQKQKPTQQHQQNEMSEAEELDFLLDKINEVGYAALSPNEKERLDKLASK